jgi:hypothetical protein
MAAPAPGAGQAALRAAAMAAQAAAAQAEAEHEEAMLQLASAQHEEARFRAEPQQPQQTQQPPPPAQTPTAEDDVALADGKIILGRHDPVLLRLHMDPGQLTETLKINEDDVANSVIAHLGSIGLMEEDIPNNVRVSGRFPSYTISIFAYCAEAILEYDSIPIYDPEDPNGAEHEFEVTLLDDRGNILRDDSIEAIRRRQARATAEQQRKSKTIRFYIDMPRLCMTYTPEQLEEVQRTINTNLRHYLTNSTIRVTYTYTGRERRLLNKWTVYAELPTNGTREDLLAYLELHKLHQIKFMKIPQIDHFPCILKMPKDIIMDLGLQACCYRKECIPIKEGPSAGRCDGRNNYFEGQRKYRKLERGEAKRREREAQNQAAQVTSANKVQRIMEIKRARMKPCKQYHLGRCLRFGMLNNLTFPKPCLGTHGSSMTEAKTIDCCSIRTEEDPEYNPVKDTCKAPPGLCPYANCLNNVTL